jgi:hypothetical protein
MGVAIGARCELWQQNGGWKCCLLSGQTRGGRRCGPWMVRRRFVCAPKLADTRGSVHLVVHLWRWAMRAAEQDVSRENLVVLWTQVMILGVLEPPNT